MRWTALMIACLLFVLAACAGEQDEIIEIKHEHGVIVETTTASNLGSFVITEHFGASVASLAERAYVSDVVVRASLLSARDDVLTFHVIEYLKGSGGPEIAVSASTAGRNREHDRQEAILFLQHARSSNSGGSSSGTRDSDDDAPQTFAFIDSADIPWTRPGHRLQEYTGSLPEGYDVDSRNPVWLPSTQESATDGSRQRSGETVVLTNPSFVTERQEPGGVDPPIATLQEIRAAVSWVEGGDGIPGYDDCLYYAIGDERHERDIAAFYDEPWEPYHSDASVASGAPAGTYITKWDDLYQLGYDPTPPHVFMGDPAYNREWLSGPDADLFVVRLIDDDTNPTNGYHFEEQNARPLPQGSYRFRGHLQLYHYIPCDYVPEQAVSDWTIHVIAPEGTVHESLFDPVSSGDAVGYFGAGGMSKPSFELDGATLIITELRATASEIVMGVSPYNALPGHSLSFIETDGSVRLFLNTADAIGDSPAETLTWTTTEPWDAGDTLMLRLFGAEP